MHKLYKNKSIESIKSNDYLIKMICALVKSQEMFNEICSRLRLYLLLPQPPTFCSSLHCLCYLGDYYRKLDTFQVIAVLLLVITVFPMASLHFYPHTASIRWLCNMQLTIIVFPVADIITAAKTCTSIITHCFKFLLGNSICMLAIKVSYSQKLQYKPLNKY